VNETAASQYDLVCDKKSMINNFNSIGFFGFLCSQLYSGFLADKFGRKPIMLVSVICVAVVGFAVAVFNDIGVNVYGIGRFFMMFFLSHTYLWF